MLHTKVTPKKRQEAYKSLSTSELIKISRIQNDISRLSDLEFLDTMLVRIYELENALSTIIEARKESTQKMRVESYQFDELLETK